MVAERKEQNEDVSEVVEHVTDEQTEAETFGEETDKKSTKKIVLLGGVLIFVLSAVVIAYFVLKSDSISITESNTMSTEEMLGLEENDIING